MQVTGLTNPPNIHKEYTHGKFPWGLYKSKNTFSVLWVECLAPGTAQTKKFH